MRFCPDCRSEHMGIVPCGLSYAQRLRSVVTERPGERRNYYDAEAAAGLFGRKPGEARAEMADELGSRRLAWADSDAQIPSGRVRVPEGIAASMLGDVSDDDARWGEGGGNGIAS